MVEYHAGKTGTVIGNSLIFQCKKGDQLTVVAKGGVTKLMGQLWNFVSTFSAFLLSPTGIDFDNLII